MMVRTGNLIPQYSDLMLLKHRKDYTKCADEIQWRVQNGSNTKCGDVLMCLICEWGCPVPNALPLLSFIANL